MRLLDLKEKKKPEVIKRLPSISMRLLNLQKQNELENSEEKLLEKKLNSLNEEITKGIKFLNEVREKNEKEKENIKSEHASFLTEIGRQKSELESEVSALEERKRIALISLAEVKLGLDQQEKELINKQNDLFKRESELELEKMEVGELADKYEERFGELTDLQNELKVRKDRLEEEIWRFNAHMKYRESALLNNHQKLRAWFEQERDSIKKLKEIKN